MVTLASRGLSPLVTQPRVMARDQGAHAPRSPERSVTLLAGNLNHAAFQRPESADVKPRGGVTLQHLVHSDRRQFEFPPPLASFLTRRFSLRRPAGRNSRKDRPVPSDRIDIGTEEIGHTHPARQHGTQAEASVWRRRVPRGCVGLVWPGAWPWSLISCWSTEPEAFVCHTACHRPGTRGQAVERHRQRRRDARRPVFRLSLSITVLCLAAFVDAPSQEAVGSWTEELNRLGDRFFRNFEIVVSFCDQRPVKCSTT